MPTQTFAILIASVILMAGLTVAVATSLAVPLWGLGLTALILAVLVRLWARSR